MLHWLRSIVPKRYQLLCKLCLFVCGMHIFGIASLFLSSTRSHSHSFEIAKRLDIHADSTIVVMPFYQSINSGRARSAARSARPGSAKKIAHQKAGTQLVSNTPKANNKKKNSSSFKQTKKAVDTKKQQIKKNSSESKKSENKKTVCVKKIAGKKAESVAKKQETDKKVVEKKEVKADNQEKKQETEKNNTERNSLEKNAAEKKIEQTVAPEPEKNREAAVADHKNNHEELEHDNCLYVGQQEYEAIALQRYLQQELSAVWQPPQGLPDDVQCELSFTVDRQGVAAAITVSRSSGALVYDISARSALSALEFPEWARAKSFKIVFKQ